MGKIKIKTITGFIRKLEQIQKEYTSGPIFFRGQSKYYKTIQPSIYRNEEWIINEENIFREFILRNPSEFSGETTTFEKLVKMQHYSLPTRLLDITANPLVALFFAVEKNNRDDGDFIVLKLPDRWIKYYNSDTVSVVSNISKRPIDTLNIKTLPSERISFNKTKEIDLLVNEIKKEKPYFKPEINRRDLEDIWFVKPLQKNPRLIKQDGCFLLFGIDGNKINPAKFVDNSARTDGEGISTERWSIDNKSKKKILYHLELLGISRDKLFPELDETAIYLKNKYIVDNSITMVCS